MQYFRFTSPVLKFPITHEVCREFNSYLELRPFISSSLNIYPHINIVNKQKNTRSANLEYTGDYPLNWNPLMINHITLL